MVQQVIDFPKIDLSKKSNELTPEQRTAVEHVSGPLLIIAGAGTGKTTVITRRLEHLLRERKLSGDKILAITFSNKATEEMETRLDALMPIGFEGPWINTFHAFGERILRQEALAFGLDPSFTVLTGPQQHLLVRRNFDRFELDYYRPSGNPTKFISALLQHFSRAKDEAVTPEQYLVWAESNLKKVEHATPESSATEDHAALLEEAQRHLEVAKAYGTYQDLLRQEGALDLADLILKPLELFKKRPSVLAKYRKQFEHILVDEFQDTNSAQFSLIKLLAEPRNNLVVVADDDQAIYRWRGASVANVLEFMNEYPKAKKVALLQNYRSTQEILDAAYRAVQFNNPDRLEQKLGIKKQLVATRGKGKLPVHYLSKSREHELAHLTNLIAARHEQGRAWSDIAVLVRSNAAAEEVVEQLGKAHIPFSFMATKGLFSRPEVLDLLAWLRVIVDYNDSVALFRILKTKTWAIAPLDLVALLHFAKRYSLSLYAALESVAAAPGPLQGEQDPGPVGEFEAPRPVVKEASRLLITRLLKLVAEHTAFAQEKTAGQTLFEYVTKTKLLTNLTKTETNENAEQVLNINQFFKLIFEFERGSSDKSVRALLEFYDQMVAAGESPTPADLEATPNAVKILTVHAAKGLEFPVVALFNMVERHFPSTARHDPIELPVQLVARATHLDLDLDQKTAHLAEERRLFYVACTRARDELILTSCVDDGGLRKRKPSRFIAEAGIPTRETVEQEIVKLAQAPDFFESERKVKLPLPTRFSYTQLTVFESCPLQYKYAHIYKIPSLGSPTFSYGKSIHETLAQFYRELAEQSAAPPLARLLELLDHYWISEWYHSKDQEVRRKAEAKQALTRWYEEYGTKAKPAFWVEQDFKLKIGKFTLNGRVDRADLLPDGTLEIIDYKTGKLKDPKKQQKNDQLAIYALAAQKTFKQKVSKLTWLFIDEGQSVSTTRTQEQLAALEKSVGERIEEIIKSDFVPTPGFHCKFCDFNKICEAGQASGYV